MPNFGWEEDLAEAAEDDETEDEGRLDDIDPKADTDELKESWLEADEGSRIRGIIEDELRERGKVPPEAQEKDTQGTLDETATAGDESDSEESESDTPDEPEEAESVEVSGESEQGDPFADLAGDSLDPRGAKRKTHRKRVLLWGPPNVGKTHSAFTADEPIAIIDTEGKAHDLADKFPETTYRIWQPKDYDEAAQHLDQALEWLEAWHSELGELGTLVVDSMSIMWEWSKQKYVEEYYPMKDPESVDLKSGFGGGESDWKKIKEYHNANFRKPMVQSPFHLVWTAMATEDFAEMMERSLDTAPDKPAGEKENPYKVNYILHIRENSDGVPVGDLEKSGITQRTFAGLEWPTLPEMFEVIEDIKAAETTEGEVPASDVTDYDVDLIKGKPSRLRGVEDDE